MNIAQIEVAHYSVPSSLFAKNEVTDTTHHIPSLEIIMARIHTDTGVEGIGYTYTTGHNALAVKQMILEEIIPVYLQQPVRRYDYLWNKAWWNTHWAGRGGVSTLAMAAVDIGVWDALAKAAGMPLYKFIGEHRQAIPAYGSGVNLSYSLEELLEETREHLECGFAGVKIKVGKPDMAEDAERLKAVRKLVGSKVKIMVDANMGWQMNEALIRAGALKEIGMAWIEEPFIPEDIDAHALLGKIAGIPIAAGENLYSRFQFKDYFAKQAIQVVQADVIRCGGITEWLKVARLAEVYNLPMAPHFVVDLHVSLLCAIPNAYIAEYLPWFHPIQIDPVTTTDGILRPKDLPGHGIEFNWALLKSYRVDDSAAE
ncbi:mandelate racemase/muconate lactonizing enzyme family protein [Compostibacter hankyongensis]|uniref:Mandelate racemase/muconate lactonizing enzyme family protein n=1 Tax=Compostibacter hankyongensis TaxID=1007089 RepID=A0ABP8FK23_9BACT